MRGFGGELGRVSERAMPTLVGLSILARGIVKFLEACQPRRVPFREAVTPTANVSADCPLGGPACIHVLQGVN